MRRRQAPSTRSSSPWESLVGALVAIGLTYSLPATEQYGYQAVVGYTALTLGLVGGLLGGALALLLDRRR